MTAGRGRVIDRDLGYRAIMARLAGLHSVAVRVGIRGDEGDVYEATEDGVRRVPSLAEIAAANEFGTSRIPERSFLRSTVDEHRAKYVRLMAVAVDQMIDGMPPLMAYGRVGLVAVGDVQRKIRNRIPPPNAPETIDAKGSDTPLVDTGRLRQSIEYVVEGV